jgi:flavin reductase (DIM6/NTAB) family NADH-FMN oxidoreductase RutF/DNA-binding IclR family transcriptional regulator
LADTELQPKSVAAPIDRAWFRRVLGQYPTGVCVITAELVGTGPVGMVVGTFTSVSLDPPLVAFLPDAKSTTWPLIERAGKFCVNILSAEQEETCRKFFAKSPDRFAPGTYETSYSGSPIISGAVAWIDCDVESSTVAGDHYIVLGRCRELSLGAPELPLLFYQGGYGKFSPHSLAAPDLRGALTTELRYVDLIRHEMELVAEAIDGRVTATARVENELVVVAGAGRARADAGRPTTIVGQRVPYLPPSGAVFAAWDESSRAESWLATATDQARVPVFRDSLSLVKQRGFSVGLIGTAQREFASTLDGLAAGSGEMAMSQLRSVLPKLEYDPPVLDAEATQRIRQISTPVFGPNGEVVLALTAYGYGRPRSGIEHYVDVLLEAARRASELIRK